MTPAPRRRRSAAGGSGARGHAAWTGVRGWFARNTFAPPWLPPPWRRPAAGYALAVLLQVVAIALVVAVTHAFPSFKFPGLLEIVAVALAALSWGAGPSLIATAVGAVLLAYYVIPSMRSFAFNDPAAVVGEALFLAAGATVSIVASRTEQARRYAEDAWYQAEAANAQLHAVLDVLPVGVLIADRQGRLLRTNAAARRIWGENLPLARNMGEYGAYKGQWAGAGEPIAADEWGLARALTRGESAIDEEIDIETFDGRRRTVLNSAVPIRDRRGAIAGGAVAIVDITARRALERRTEESLHALLAMAETLVAGGDAVASPDMTTDGPGLPSATGRRLADLTRHVLGCSRLGIVALDEETEMQRPVAVAGLDAAQERAWWRRTEGTSWRDQEAAFPTLAARLRAGEAVLVDMTSPPLRDLPNPFNMRVVLIAPLRVAGRLVGLLSLDYGDAPHTFTPDEVALAEAVGQLTALVIERERLIHERAEARAGELALRETNRRMGEFLSVASHELKSPLTAIKGNVQLVQQRLHNLAEAPRAAPDLAARLDTMSELLGRVDAQASVMARLVDELLDVSRIEADHLELRLAPTNLAALLREAVDAQRHAWPARAITLDVPTTPVTVDADADRIAQVLTNYITNALKYSDAGRPVAMVLTINTATGGATSEARVDVRDEGAGITPEQQAHVWDRFHRVEGIAVRNYTSGSGGGLGLGLYISRTIVEAHGGRVGLESAPGQGSTFWFTLPLAS